MCAVKLPMRAEELRDLKALRSSIERSVPTGRDGNKEVTGRMADALMTLGQVSNHGNKIDWDRCEKQMGSLGGDADCAPAVPRRDDLVDDGERVLAHIEPGTADALLDYLQKMVFWSKVEVGMRDDLGVVWRPGPSGMDGADAFAFVAQDAVAATDGSPAGTWAYEALRVVAGRPRLGLDTDHRTIPAEVNWIGDAVHLEKGCYRGQEIIHRIDSAVARSSPTIYIEILAKPGHRAPRRSE